MKPTPQLPKVHKVILNSTDKSSGTNFNAFYTNVRLPDTFHRQAVVIVESVRRLYHMTSCM